MQMSKTASMAMMLMVGTDSRSESVNSFQSKVMMAVSDSVSNSRHDNPDAAMSASIA